MIQSVVWGFHQESSLGSLESKLPDADLQIRNLLGMPSGSTVVRGREISRAGQKERSSADLLEVLMLTWPSGVLPNWGKIASHSTETAPGRESDCRQGGFLLPWQFSKELAAE